MSVTNVIYSSVPVSHDRVSQHEHYQEPETEAAEGIHPALTSLFTPELFLKINPI